MSLIPSNDCSSRANSKSLCHSCPAGKYGDKEGMGTCTTCPRGKYQPNTGEHTCMECIAIDKLKTNNTEHTSCIDNEALKSDTIIEMMFETGTAMFAACGISVLFTLLCGFMQYKREKASDDNLGQIERFQVMLKSAPQGLSFGSELFLVAGMLSTAPGLAAVMILFRSMHPCAVIYVFLAMYGGMAWTQRCVSDADTWNGLIHEDFAKANIPVVGAITILSLCDVTMVQMLPWKNVAFYKESNGFVTMSLMRVCLGVEIIQSIVSVLCQTIFLFMFHDINDPFMSTYAKILFGLNIFSSMMTVLISLIKLFFKQVFLKQAKRLSADCHGFFLGGGRENWAGKLISRFPNHSI